MSTPAAPAPLVSEAFVAMLDIAAAIGERLDPGHIAQLAVDRAQSLLGADAAYLWLWDPEEEALHTLAGVDPRAPVERASEDVDRLGNSLVGQVFAQRQPVVVNDYQNWIHARRWVAELGAKTAAGVPLLVNDRPVGTIIVHNYVERVFEEPHVQLLSLFASQVAPALEAARLYAESERRRHEAEAAREEVRALNVQLEQRVADRTAQLRAAVEELEAFSYSVSHDLRAPLRSIDGFSQVLLEDYADKLDDEGRHHLDRVRAASQRMARLIDDLLQLARVTRAEMTHERVDLSRLAQSIAADLRERDPERQATFDIQPEVTAEGDPRLLRIVLENLLSNAWKFTSQRAMAHIAFGTTEAKGAPAYVVQDDGAGFDMTYVDKLFGPFQRLHSVSEFEGTGIGLATVKRIISRHGGTVWAEAEVDHGARFFFTL